MAAVFPVLAATGGLVVLHASQVQPKNTSSVLIANLLSIAVATLAYWACGYAFAVGDGTSTGETSNFFMSHTRFFLMDAVPADYVRFLDNVVVLGLVVVIVNSGFAARMRCWIYPIVVTIVGGFLYPCVFHWTNATDGWLKKGINVLVDAKEQTLSYTDTYGSASIHVFGGSCALIASILVGSRKERRGKTFQPLGGNLNPLIVVGGVLALIGLVAKNSPTPVAWVNNLLAAQGAALVAFMFKRCKCCGDTSGTKSLINGALAGVVGVSGAPGEYETYYAFAIGVVAGLAYVMWSAMFQCCHVDDPTDSAAVHFGGGLWAVLAAPIFRNTTGVIATKGATFGFQTFGWHLLADIAIFVWAGLTLFIICVPFLATRIITYRNAEAVTRGLDAFEHIDPAFPDRNQYSPEDYDANNLLDEIMPVAKGGTFKVASFDNATLHANIEGQNQWGYCNDAEWAPTKY